MLRWIRLDFGVLTEKICVNVGGVLRLNTICENDFIQASGEFDMVSPFAPFSGLKSWTFLWCVRAVGASLKVFRDSRRFRLFRVYYAVLPVSIFVVSLAVLLNQLGLAALLAVPLVALVALSISSVFATLLVRCVASADVQIRKELRRQFLNFGVG